ncbi:dihydrolipoyl dehydrogenase [Comamonas sp. NLF-1-9]|uniref:dihydrolipoyl dehydrogenase n=1 Tax=Comamonas sp. NLF-1-9 TaxID=2853163 RepID=UPI001C464CB5|nr:dihydrolipoyl dehydrogenase [Comamonas sp. NLF-1-9]QXL83571.1 dihydrolipoyl dehydrogenase [Comamonas sp. NLF-1-9]
MKEISTKLLVIGGGPGGYVAAIRAGQLGVPTVLAEGASLGGTCLNIGCIPSKALIHAAHDFEQARLQAAGNSPMGIRVSEPALDLAQTVRWKDGIVKRLTSGVGALLRKAGVQVLHGWATVEDGKTAVVQLEGEAVRVRCEHLLIATGSEPVALPSMPFGGAIWSSTDALSPTELPRRLVVVGAGYIGLELSFAYRKLGTEVTVVEAAPDILPRYDEALTKPVLDSLKKAGVVLHLGCSVAGYDAKNGVHVRNANADEFALPADKVLVAVGRRPRATGFGIESLQLTMNGRAIAIDAHCATSMRKVWAIGDVTGEPVLAHRAMAQGECVAEQIAGKPRRFEPMAIPAVCFTDPEVVITGLTAQEASAAGVETVEASFPFAANGRAMTLGAEGGFVRVLARKSDHVIIGWHAVGRSVSELSAAFGQSIEMGARLEDVAGTIHAHPTLGEAVQEAAMRALGHSLHI